MKYPTICIILSLLSVAYLTARTTRVAPLTDAVDSTASTTPDGGPR